MNRVHGGRWLFPIVILIGWVSVIRAHVSHMSQSMHVKEIKKSASKNATVSDLYNLLEDIVALKVAMLLDEEDESDKVPTILSRSRRQVLPQVIQAPQMLDPNWFANVYLPWLNQWLEYQNYESQRRQYITNYLTNNMPVSYGSDASHGGSYRKYSMQAYNQYLYDLAKTAPISEAVNRGYCLRDWDGTVADTEPCWSTDYDSISPGFCSTLTGGGVECTTTPSS